ncbi:hypothetical protein, partial [Anaplasma marginale]|uniref:hypothetical protein n=1 Tax=Anaplasma marginale TaxID=770 RepID=UPI0005B38F71
VNQLSKYILKDGNEMKYKNIPKESIQLFIKCSSIKKDKYKEKIQKLEEEYISGEIDDKLFGVNYICLLSDSCNKGLYTNHIRAYLLKMKVKKDSSFSNLLYDEIMRNYL